MPVLVVDVPKNGDLIAEYLMDGASGCLAVEHGLDELINALETMQEDCPYLPPSVQAVLLQQFVTVRRQFIDAFGGIHSRDDLGLDELTDREREVLELVAQELTNRQISELLFLEVGTVKNHVHSILTKLELPDRTAAAEYQRHAASFSSPTPAARSNSHRQMYPVAMSR
ncbi:MAG: response regulator transcription factor [Thermomicrobiales bacterium]